MSHASKRARFSDESQDVLRGFCRRGSISNKGLQFLLARLKEHPELVDVSRTEMMKQFHARFDMVKTSVNLPNRDGRVSEWAIADPGLLLSMVLRERRELANMFVIALEAHPCSESNPWRIIVGFDEFTPGNKTKLDNRKKCMVTSFSFLELGLENLGRDAAWMTPAVALHTSIAQVIGGWPFMLKVLLRLLLVGPHGLTTTGVPFEVDDKHYVLFGTLSCLLSDGDGLREALDWKGAKGIKPCFRHWNLVNRNTDLVHRDPDRRLVDLTCCDPAKFLSWLPNELEATIDMLTESQRRVAGGTMTVARLENIEKATGFNTNQHGLLADARLRSLFQASKIATFDWMHTALQNGTVTDEVFRYTKACEAIGLTHTDIEAYLKEDWQFPANSRSSHGLHRVFNDYRSSSSDKADRLKASASEMIGLYGLLRHWAATRVGDHAALRAERVSFEAACDTVDIILQAKRGNIAMPVASRMLSNAVANHLRCHIAAYGADGVKPKHHWMFDIAEQMSSLPLVVDAFIIERIHLRIKRNAEKVHELGVFEKSVMAGVVNSIFDEASKPSSDGLRGATLDNEGTLLGDHLCVGSLRVDAGDVIARGNEVAVVSVCAEEDGLCYVVVQKCTYVDQVSLEIPVSVCKHVFIRLTFSNIKKTTNSHNIKHWQVSRYGSRWRLSREHAIFLAVEIQQVYILV